MKRALLLVLTLNLGCGVLNGLIEPAQCAKEELAPCTTADDCIPCGQLCSSNGSCVAPDFAFDECALAGQSPQSGDGEMLLDRINVDAMNQLFVVQLTDLAELDEEDLTVRFFADVGDDELEDDAVFIGQVNTDAFGNDTAVLTLTSTSGMSDNLAFQVVNDARRSNTVCVIAAGFGL